MCVHVSLAGGLHRIAQRAARPDRAVQAHGREERAEEQLGVRVAADPDQRYPGPGLLRHLPHRVVLQQVRQPHLPVLKVLAQRQVRRNINALGPRRQPPSPGRARLARVHPPRVHRPVFPVNVPVRHVDVPVWVVSAALDVVPRAEEIVSRANSEHHHRHHQAHPMPTLVSHTSELRFHKELTCNRGFLSSFVSSTEYPKQHRLQRIYLSLPCINTMGTFQEKSGSAAAFSSTVVSWCISQIESSIYKGFPLKNSQLNRDEILSQLISASYVPQVPSFSFAFAQKVKYPGSLLPVNECIHWDMGFDRQMYWCLQINAVFPCCFCSTQWATALCGVPGRVHVPVK